MYNTLKAYRAMILKRTEDGEPEAIYYYNVAWSEEEMRGYVKENYSSYGIISDISDTKKGKQMIRDYYADDDI